jgi:hypothetical protein
MKPLQWAVVAFGAADLALTLGYYFQLEWATSTWPWPVQPLDFLLVSSFLAGATVVILWLGLTGEWGAATGATMNVGLMNAGAAIYLFRTHAETHEPGLLRRALAFTLFALVNGGVLLWSLRHPIRDKRPVDKLLRVSFGLFSAVLLFAAVQLLRRSPTIFPWPIEPETETMFGWLFLGSAAYFLYGFLRPSWHNARGQLLAFLAYDLVLIVPYAWLFQTVQPEHFRSLCVYMAVLVYSSLLSIWYLFLNPKTRKWRIQD